MDSLSSADCCSLDTTHGNSFRGLTRLSTAQATFRAKSQGLWSAVQDGLQEPWSLVWNEALLRLRVIYRPHFQWGGVSGMWCVYQRTAFQMSALVKAVEANLWGFILEYFLLYQLLWFFFPFCIWNSYLVRDDKNVCHWVRDLNNYFDFMSFDQVYFSQLVFLWKVYILLSLTDLLNRHVVPGMVWLIGFSSQNWLISKVVLCHPHPISTVFPVRAAFLHNTHDMLFSRSVMSHSFSTPWPIAHQAPLSMRFPRQEN